MPVQLNPYGSIVNVRGVDTVMLSEVSAPMSTVSPSCAALTAAANESYAKRLAPLSIAAFFPPSM